MKRVILFNFFHRSTGLRVYGSTSLYMVGFERHWANSKASLLTPTSRWSLDKLKNYSAFILSCLIKRIYHSYNFFSTTIWYFAFCLLITRLSQYLSPSTSYKFHYMRLKISSIILFYISGCFYIITVMIYSLVYLDERS